MVALRGDQLGYVYAEKGDFSKSLAECFEDMLVKHLGGFTEDKLMAFVKSEGGPNGLVPAWLKKHGLRSYLDGYVASMDASSTLETASRQMGALSLSSSGSLTRKIIIQQFGSTSSGRHVSFECLKGENFLPTAEARVRDEFQISPSG